MKRTIFFQPLVLLLAAFLTFILPVSTEAAQLTSIASSVVESQEATAASTADDEQSDTTQPLKQQQPAVSLRLLIKNSKNNLTK